MTKLPLLALLLPAVALANGYDVPNVNPRDLAMAGSLTASQRDAAAAYANPAALSRLDGLNVAVAGTMLVLSTKWTGDRSLAGQSSSLQWRPAFPPSVFAAYGFKLGNRAAGVGVGMNVPGGGNVFWKNDWPGRGRIITVDRRIYGIYLTGGYEVLTDLRVGGGVVYYYGTEYLKQGVQPFNGAYGELSTRGGSFSFDLSAEYKLRAIPLTLAIDYKHKGTMKLKGDAHFVVPGGILTTDPPPVDQGVRHTLVYPNTLNVAAAYQVTKPLLVTAAWTFNRYVTYQADLFAGSRGTSIVVPRNYRNGWTFRFGGEYDLNPRFTVRAGVLRDVSGQDRNFVSPTLPDADTWAGTAGLGWRARPDLTLDAGFFYARMDPVKVTGDFELPGTYKTRVWILSLGGTWRTDLAGGK